MNNVTIDSLIKEYNRFSIAKINQHIAINKLMEIFDADSTEVVVKRNNKILKEVFYMSVANREVVKRGFVKNIY